MRSPGLELVQPGQRWIQGHCHLSKMRGDKIALDAGTLSPVEFTDCPRMCCHSRIEEVSEALLALGLITRKSEAEDALEELSIAIA